MDRRLRLLLISAVMAVGVLAVGVTTGTVHLPWDDDSPASAFALEDVTFGQAAAPPGYHLPDGDDPVVSFQGRLTDPGTGLPVGDSSYSTTFRIFDDDAGGSMLWMETQSVSTNGGLFSVLLGSVTPMAPGVFAGTPRYLEVQVSPDPAMTPRLQFAYVPYAFTAEQAGTVGRLGFSITTIDSVGQTYSQPSIATGVDGLPIVSYYDSVTDNLKVVHCGNSACSDANTITTIDSVGNLNAYSSVAIGADDLPIVSYHDTVDLDLKVVHCGNVACSAGNIITTVDSAGSVGEYSSITVGSDGLPVISYEGNGNLKVVHCGNVACSGGNAITTVDSTFSTGEFTSVAIGIDGLPVIAYNQISPGELMVAHCGDTACSAGNSLNTVGSGVGLGSNSIAIGESGLPLIATIELVLACDDESCTGSSEATVFFGDYPAMTIGADGLPVITYSNPEQLVVAHCGSYDCSDTSVTATTSIDPMLDMEVGFSSITLGTDGLPIITYYDVTNGLLKVAHCSNRFCIPHYRPR